MIQKRSSASNAEHRVKLKNLILTSDLPARLTGCMKVGRFLFSCQPYEGKLSVEMLVCRKETLLFAC